MRKAAAILALAVSLFGLPLGFLSGFAWANLFTFGVFWLALVVSAVAALRGSDLIYLAAVWGVFVGMNLAASIDVFGQMSGEGSPEANFGAALVISVIALALLGLTLTLIANARERHS